jgi:hypothetical protein
MSSSPALDPDVANVLTLSQADPAHAQALLDAQPLENLVALVCRAPAHRREELLKLLDHPERVIALLPDAELCFTAKAVGLHDAGWLLASATNGQLIAALDLDAWQGLEFDLEKFDTWMNALAHAGDTTLVRVTQHVDTELIYLYLLKHLIVDLKPPDSESNDDWQPPIGAQTIDGQFYFAARKEKDDLETILRLSKLLFTEDYWLYFRLMQAVIHELPSENEEFALRWRQGRLEDLGFPAWATSMSIYSHLKTEDRRTLPEEINALDVEAWKLPVWAPPMPVRSDGSEYAIFRAAGLLNEEERSAFFFAFIALANKVAVAEKMPLGDVETLPDSIAKAAEGTSIGFTLLSEAHPASAADLLRRVTLDRLFRIGANEQRDANA